MTGSASNPESKDSPTRNCASEVWCTKTKIRSIVLVTMLSLLLELVLIRWLASGP
jgi:hypothetical protein